MIKIISRDFYGKNNKGSYRSRLTLFFVFVFFGFIGVYSQFIIIIEMFDKNIDCE